MISATLFGGLGNQMFIYAMVRALALRNNTSYAFNKNNGFITDVQFQRFLELQHFDLSLPMSQIHTYDFGKTGRIIKFFSRKFGRNILCPHDKYMIEDRNMHFEELYKNKQLKNAYLEGYWQSAKYFEDYEDIIRKDFSIKTKIPDSVLEEVNFLKSQKRQLVMVGIRRYQECKKQSYLTEHLCGKEYYSSAIKFINERIENPLFVVFSQDRVWVENNVLNNFKDNFYFVKEKTGELSALSDLYIMQSCNHAIISNSSFYWWGAWLQPRHNEQIIVAPDNFINKDSPCSNWKIIHV